MATISNTCHGFLFFVIATVYNARCVCNRHLYDMYTYIYDIYIYFYYIDVITLDEFEAPN